MNIPTFTFAAEWHDDPADGSGYRPVVKFDDVEVWRARDGDVKWDEAAAIEAARDHLVARLRTLLDDNDPFADPFPEIDERVSELERTTSNLDESVSNLTSDVERIDGRVDRLYENPDD